MADSEETQLPEGDPTAEEERKYEDMPYEKIVGAARWGLESNALEITDSLNPEEGTTQLVGKAKVGAAVVAIIDKPPDVLVQAKFYGAKAKKGDRAFLANFWLKLEVEAGLQDKNEQNEFDALKKGDYHTYVLTDTATMDLLADQSRWGLEKMGIKISESLRPDLSHAVIKGSGKIGKQKTTAIVSIVSLQNMAIVQFRHTLKLKPTDKIELGEIAKFWEQLRLQMGDSLEEQGRRDEYKKELSAEDARVQQDLGNLWARIVQGDKALVTVVPNIEYDQSKVEEIVGSELVRMVGERTMWPLVPVHVRALRHARADLSPVLVDLSYIKVEDVPAHPTLFTFARVGPHLISKELRLSDKKLFSYDGQDFTDPMGQHLNYEEPLLAKYIREAYSAEFLTHYEAEVTAKDPSGNKYRKNMDYILKEPVHIFNATVGGDERMVIMARAFASPDASKTPQPSAFVRMLDKLLESLDTYCIKPEVAPESEAEEQPKAESGVVLNRCPFCNWILTPGKKVCPMCRKELPAEMFAASPTSAPESGFVPPPPPAKSILADESAEGSIIAEPSFPEITVPTAPEAEMSVDQINDRIQQVNTVIQNLQNSLNGLQAAFTAGNITFDEYQTQNDQYVQQIAKLQEEKRKLDRKKFELEFKF